MHFVIYNVSMYRCTNQQGLKLRVREEWVQSLLFCTTMHAHYVNYKMHNTLKAISNQKYSNVLENIGDSDITHNINFYLFKNIIKKIGKLEENITTQRNFLINIGIQKRAEIISKNLVFSKKVDVYHRLQRLIDQKQMGSLFKVMFIKNKNSKFNLGF